MYQYPFVIKKKKKPLSNLGIEEKFQSLIKNIYEKCIANIILNAEKLEVVLIGTRQGCPVSLLILNILLEVLLNAIKQVKEIKGILCLSCS